MSDILRQALAVAYQTAPHNRYGSFSPLGPLRPALRAEPLEEFSQILSGSCERVREFMNRILGGSKLYEGICHLLAP